MPMMIGQSHSVFPADEIKSRLGGWNALPPHVGPATEHDFWKLVATQEFDVCSKQLVVAKGPWVQARDLVAPIVDGFKEPSILLPNVRLFMRPDLSGVMVVLDYGWPSTREYLPRYFSFAACQHTHVRSKSLGYAVESTCEACGFWTSVDSGD